jgi:hypothetical protein
MKTIQHNLLKSFPGPDELQSDENSQSYLSVHKVNGHIHTPYSFSSFTGFDQIFRMALEEDIKVLGINDFYTMGGYETFYQFSLENKVFPLFNIEFIGLSAGDQRKGIRINDPNNPGRIYLSGKGLKFPVCLNDHFKTMIDQVIIESQKQVSSMLDKTNDLLKRLHSSLRISMTEIRDSYTKEMVRERHLAKAIRIKIFETIKGKEEQIAFLRDLFGGKEPEAALDEIAALENEIRSELLKTGGAAFVAEDEKAFLTIEQIIELILHAGGIPCYPVLLDDKEGKFTDIERDWFYLVEWLRSYGISCIELIPGRNSYPVLKDFVTFFPEHEFVILFGTEHNTPDLLPLTVSCRNNISLDEELKKISFEGACVVAAHQYLNARGMTGYVDNKVDDISKRERFVKLGKAVIEKFITTE